MRSELAQPTLDLERELLELGYRNVAGVDEVGRGSWAGPVVAAAVMLPSHRPGCVAAFEGVRDSKQLGAEQRAALYRVILGGAVAVGIGWASHHAVDRDGLAAANRRAMVRAVMALPAPPDALILDHFALPELAVAQLSVDKGDARSLSVAAASIVAKVFRDRWMIRCDGRFPAYGFASHKGYGTRRHRDALLQHGPCPLHRRSFVPIAQLTPQ